MAEIQSLEDRVNDGGGGGSIPVATSENFSSKRQRRPSVRLGDIGDQPYDSNLRRTKQWSKLPLKDSNLSGKGSKSRPLMNIGSSSGGCDFHETLEGEDEGNLDSVAIGSWKVKDSKSKRGSTKRVRSNWGSKVDEGGGGGGSGEGDNKYSGGEDVHDDRFRDFNPEGSESPLKEQSPIHSLDNMAIDIDRGQDNDREILFNGQRRQIRTGVSEGIDHLDWVELSGPSLTEARDWKCGTNADRNGNSGQERCLDDGVRIWLNGLGLGRYAPVFEIHEVDDEVLPMLTLEDLKDMGINAVGSRRKMYCAIQKLGQVFS